MLCRFFFLFLLPIVSVSSCAGRNEVSTILQETDGRLNRFHEEVTNSELYKKHGAFFDDQMNSAINNSTHQWVLNSKDQEFYAIFRDIYAQNISLLDMQVCSIPKKIHQIWIGSEPPQELLELSAAK